MKSTIFIALVFISFLNSYGQEGNKLLFESTEVVWCGLDYSMVKCIGGYGFNEPDQIKNKYFEGWNQLMLAEPSKYNFKEAYDIDSQITDLSVVERRNDIPEIDSLVINEEYHFEPGAIKNVIKDYNLKKAKEGLGLVYIVESLDKTKIQSTIYVVFFDIATKEILWGRKYTHEAKGFGFRNYWAYPIYSTIKASGNMFRKEKKKYLKGR